MPQLSLFHSDQPYSHKVVVVEDDADDFELTRISFQKANFENEVVWLDEGCKLIDYLLCRNGFESSGHANPLLIFLDLNMPKWNGQETIEAIKKHRDLATLRIVILTNADKTHMQSIGLGEWPHIQKPLDFEKMYEYISSSNQFLFL